MSNTRTLLAALGLAIGAMGGTACSCNGNNTGKKPVGSSTIILTPEQTRITLAPQRRVEVSFVATLGQNGQAIGGLRVDGALDPNNGGSRLSIDSVTTDDQGRAVFWLEAGPTGATFQMRATAEQADPVTVDVEVNGKFRGNIVVRSGYSGTSRIGRLEVRLHDGRSGCDPRWAELQELPRGLRNWVETVTTPSTSKDARFEGLSEGTKYIATVVAKSALDKPIAFGCGPAATVVAGRDTTINVRLADLAPIVQGKYRFGQEINLLGFMDQKTATYRALQTLSNLLRDPGRGLANGIVTESNPHAGACDLVNLSGAACDTVGILIGDALKMGINAISPTAGNIYGGITNTAKMVFTPRFGGHLEVKTYNQNTKEWTGEYVFDSYNFVWDFGASFCKDNNDPCCSHRVFEGSKIGLVAFSAPVKGKVERDTTVSTTMTPTYKFTMEDQALAIAAGSITLALLENVALPLVMPENFPRQTPGRISVGELITGLISKADWADCEGKNSNLCATIKGGVNNAVQLLTAALRFDGNEKTHIKQRIEVATLVDTDDDHQLDDFQADIVTHAQAGGTATPSDSTAHVRGRVMGSLSCTGDVACNQQRPTDPRDPFAANLQLVCRIAQDPVDGCFAANFCGVPEGARKGGEACTQDNECYSGSCMKRPSGIFSYTSAQVDKCYKACATDTDCAGEGTCDVDGFAYSPSSGSSDVTVTGTCIRL